MESFGGSDVMLVAAFAWFEGLFSYSAVLPSIMTIGTFVDTPEKVAMIRQGEAIGTVINMIFGALLGYFTKSWIPLVLMATACLVMLGVYEYALRQAPVWGEVGGEVGNA